MADLLRIVLGVLVVASLAAIVVYVVTFAAAAAWTVLASRRRDPLAEELDRVLAGVAGPQGSDAFAVEHVRLPAAERAGGLPGSLARRRFS